MNSTRLLLLLVCVSCVDRPAPADTDTDDATSSTTDAGTDTAPTTGSPTWHGFAACKPIDGDAGCLMGQTCCSEDPATLGGKLPDYYGVNDDKYGLPLFSDNSNALSYFGHCIDTSEITSPLVTGCPVPCNPRWDPATIAEICGTAQCCQFTDLDPDKDCIIVDGRWRTPTGADILDKRTGWGSLHTTNQDPLAESCTQLSAGNQELLVDCIAQLTVADRRGFCYSQGCPCVEDACDMKNPDWVPRCTGG